MLINVTKNNSCILKRWEKINQSAAAMLNVQLQTSPRRMTASVKRNDQIILHISEPMLHPDAFLDHLMSTAVTIAPDTVDAI